MKKIYSKIEKNKLLHIIYNVNEVTHRDDIIPEENFLQVSVVRKNKNFKPKLHKHIFKNVDFKMSIAQECWFVYKGQIIVYHYDIDDTLIGTEILSEGDMNITLGGGHTLETLVDDTIIIESKNGPYFGVEFDKKFLE
jgi:hypothetical protein